MKRLLFVRRTYGFGGVEVILLDWLKRIDYSQYEVFVSSPADVFSKRIAENGSPTKYIHLSPEEVIHLYGRYHPEFGINELVTQSFWHFFPIWFRFLRRIKPDRVIFLDGDFFTTPLACVMAAYLVTRGNVSMTIHSPNKLQEPLPKTTKSHFGLPGLGLWWYRTVWWPLFPWRMRGRLSKRILTASRAIGERIVRFHGYPPRKMGFAGVSHGVDTTKFRPSEVTRAQCRREWGIPNDAAVVASTSRLSPEKNVAWVLNAFDTIAKDNKNVWLLLAGDGPLRSEVELIITQCSVNSRIRFLGHVQDVSSVLQSADIYVLASTFEGFGIALMEAMSVGLVCLVSNVPGPDELIENFRDGILIEPSKQGVLNGLEEALALTMPQRAGMGRHARNKILAHYQAEDAIRSALGKLGIQTRLEHASLG